MKPKGPKRPPSAYNIFFSRESKRLKRRENALVRYRTLFSPGKSQPELNCTQAIGEKWSKGRDEKAFGLFFDLIREEKMQEYCTRKELFLAETTFIGEKDTQDDPAKKRTDVRKANALVEAVRDSKVSREKLVKALMGHTARALNRIMDDVDGCKLFGTNARNGPYERVRKLVLEALGEEDTRPERIHGERARALLSLELISVLR